MTDFTGGSGDDIFAGTESSDTANGGGGSDTLTGNGGIDILAGDEGSDYIEGGSGDDFLYSGFLTTWFSTPRYFYAWNAPILDRGSEVDTLLGGEGNDRIFAGYGDIVDGGSGIGDSLYISLMGAPVGITVNFNQPSIIIGGGSIAGVENVDWVEGSNFDDDITMTSQSAFSASTSVFGMGGNDRIIASLGTVAMFGGDGNDFVDGRGSESLELIDGGAGNDVLYTNITGRSYIMARGGDGDDIIYTSFTANGDAGNDTIYIQQNFLYGHVNGGSGDDVIYSFTSSEFAMLFGDEGADTLVGSDWADVLNGGAGNDIVDGGVLYIQGQTDNDTAVFSGNVSDYLAVLNAETGVVTITDLRPGSPDGADTLSNIEKFQFADGIFILEALLSGYANSGSPNFVGTVARDIFHGSEGTSYFLGYDGDDILFGHGGDDDLYGENGADYLDGGAGRDYLYSTISISDDETLYSWNNYWEDRWTVFSLDAGLEVDTLKGGSGEDHLYAGYGDNVDGGSDTDTLFVNFRGASSGVTVDFRSNNSVVGGGIITNIEFVAMVVGSDFDDEITLGAYTPPSTSYFFSAGGVIFGLGGNDRLVAGYFTDSLFGDDGNDAIDGSGSHTLKRIDGGEGDDRLMIAAVVNATAVYGGNGFDTLAVSGAVSVGGVLDGIEALDLIEGAALTLTGSQFATGLATNTAISGTGTITVNMNSGVNFSAAGMSFAGTGVGMFVNGTSGVDVIKLGLGNSAGNTVNGGDGVDQIRGSQMVDAINGDGGNDKIMGLGGADVLTGGAGNDQFRYYSAADSGLGANADRITDFVIAGDRINFALIDADAVTAGDQAFAFIGTAAFAANGVGQVRYTNSEADLVLQADVNGDGIADMEIILQGLNGQMLTWADFIL